jgi:small basic protein (TIGR04137 family)
MSLDKSLRTNASLERHRNVLSRYERISILTEEGRFNEEKPLGLPKVAHRKAKVGAKVKKKDEKAAEGAVAAAPAAAGAKK